MNAHAKLSVTFFILSQIINSLLRKGWRGIVLALMLSTVGTSAVMAQVSAKGVQPIQPLAGTPSTKVGDHFGDWIFECVAVGEGQTLCSLNQTLIAKETNKAIARFSLSHNKKTNDNILGVLVPLGLEIPAGITVSADQNPPIQMILQTCTSNGCLANAILNAKTVQAFKSGKILTLSFTARGDEKVLNLNGSLNGLDAGLAAVGF
jgi:invasion protein IalB